ncbi:sel1 repeat family protein [Alphaproteobacteria bacterium]|nr:sel1 repeat family protein [Alphaproteobacteria bacterium]
MVQTVSRIRKTPSLSNNAIVVFVGFLFWTGSVSAENYSERQRTAYLDENPLFAQLFQASEEDRVVLFSEHTAKGANGNPKSQYLVGLAYQAGMATAQDNDQALSWLEKAALQNDLRAQYALGAALSKKGEQESSLKWFKKAAKSGYAKAQAAYGARLVMSKEQEVSQEGLNWLKTAFDQGHVPAAIMLARCYSFGFGVEREWSKVIEWYTKAAELDHPSAQFILASEYKNGHGLPKDFEKARFWAEKAAGQGIKEAEALLLELKD